MNPVVLAVLPLALVLPAPERFTAAGGNTCTEGGTTGTLGWATGGPVLTVHVRGTVVGRGTGAAGCPGAIGPVEPSHRTTATYTAYQNGWMLARETVEVSNGAAPVELDLVALAAIDQVVVEVCYPPDIQNPEGTIPDRCFADSHPINRTR
jgi:hypothetical protein